METLTTDAGPLVAYLNAAEAAHPWAARIFRELTLPVLTCDAVLSEAYHLLRGEPAAVDSLHQMLERGIVVSAFESSSEATELTRLMRRYRNVPMSFADACLVRMAELLPDTRVFTLDSDFRIYRRHGRQAIPVLMPDAT